MGKASRFAPAAGNKYESASSRRSKCSSCGKNIVKGCRRVGIEAFDPNKYKFIYNYHHVDCLDENVQGRLGFDGGRTLQEEIAWQDEVALKRAETLQERSGLYQQLLELRSALTKHDEIRLFELHLTDKTIEDIVLQLPTNFQQLSKCWGMGPSNMELIGDGILELVGYYKRRRVQPQPLAEGNRDDNSAVKAQRDPPVPV